VEGKEEGLNCERYTYISNSFYIHTTSNMSTFWRAAGMSYLQYLQASSVALRSSLKEPARTKAMKAGAVHLRERFWTQGEGGEKRIISSLSDKPATN
jgi:F-type H+-transporting ATPase subunit epsilon